MAKKETKPKKTAESKSAPQDKNQGLMVAIIVMLAVIIIGGVIWFITGNKPTSQKDLKISSSKTEVIETTKLKGDNKLAQLFDRDTYFIEIMSGGNGFSMEMIMARDGDKVYMAVPSFGIAIIAKDGNVYTLSEFDQTYTVEPMTEDEMSEISLSGIIDYAGNAVNGTETIDGVEYDTETYGDETVAYFHDGELKFIKTVGEEEMIKITRYETKVDSSLFEIPADYTLDTTSSLDYDEE